MTQYKRNKQPTIGEAFLYPTACHMICPRSDIQPRHQDAFVSLRRGATAILGQRCFFRRTVRFKEVSYGEKVYLDGGLAIKVLFDMPYRVSRCAREYVIVGC